MQKPAYITRKIGNEERKQKNEIKPKETEHITQIVKTNYYPKIENWKTGLENEKGKSGKRSNKLKLVKRRFYYW